MVAASKSSSRSSQDNIIGEGDDGGEGLGDAGDMDVASLWAELAQDSDLPVGPMIVEEKKRQNQSRQVRSVVTDDDGNDDGVARVQWPEFLDSDENDDDVDDMDDSIQFTVKQAKQANEKLIKDDDDAAATAAAAVRKQTEKASSRDDTEFEREIKILENVDDVATQRLARQMRRERRREQRQKAAKLASNKLAETAEAESKATRSATAKGDARTTKTEFLDNAYVNPNTLPGAERGKWKTHKRLRIVSGALGGRRILSPDTPSVRPMMERVRGAAMDMLVARVAKSARGFPTGSRWLDLYSGTGAVGVEAVSRGCAGAHFVECDSDVLKRVLNVNLRSLDVHGVASKNGGAAGDVVVHPMTVEVFLNRHRESRGEPFEFISVTPPYQLVDYSVLLELLGSSGALCSDRSTVLVEFPLEESRAIPEKLCVSTHEDASAVNGDLRLARERRYGRTVLAMYSPANM